MTKNFDRLNRETIEHNNRNVDRFNLSTRSNYQFRTSSSYNSAKQPVPSKSKGYYDGRGQYHVE